MAEDKVFTVTQVNNYLKHILSFEEVLAGISMEGEVQDYRVSGAHAYFTLKDANAELRCVQFGAVYGEYRPKNGDKVVVTGKIDFYIKRGVVSFNVSKIKPYGLGDLYQKFLELKEKLAKLGYFDEKHKKPIPAYPKRIGVVTAEGGAVIRDIINVARRRNPAVDVVLYPARVQGEGAEREVMAGIDYFEQCPDIDTVILARGGGSLEDLAPFYTEVLALKVFDAEKPIISAIGHETDFALTDFVADMRAPTPSAAAELAVPDLAGMFGQIKYYNQRMYALAAGIYRESRRNLRVLTGTAALKTENVLNQAKSRIENGVTRMYGAVASKLDAQLAQVRADAGRLAQSAERRLTESEYLVKNCMTSLDKLNPLALLSKGYAKVALKGREIASVRDVKAGSAIDVLVTDGVIAAKVTGSKEIRRVDYGGLREIDQEIAGNRGEA